MSIKEVIRLTFDDCRLSSADFNISDICRLEVGQLLRFRQP
jgi:hypothetical protein